MLALATFISAAAAKPHIVYLLVDDLGYANVGFHSAGHTDTDPKTPHIDSLRADGAELTAFYTYKVCLCFSRAVVVTDNSANHALHFSRSVVCRTMATRRTTRYMQLTACLHLFSLQRATPQYCSPTRSSFMSGRLPYHVNSENHPPSSPAGGVPLGMTTLADQLQGVGYTTAQIGKWHCGMSSYDRLPVARGFNSRCAPSFAARCTAEQPAAHAPCIPPHCTQLQLWLFIRRRRSFLADP